MSVLLCFLLTFLQAVIAKEVIYRNHTCAPSSYTKICILDGLQYRPDREEHVIHNFPPNQSHIRIMSRTRSDSHSTEVLDINAKFYTLIGRPAVLEVFQHALWNLELPRSLRRGIFPDTYAKNFTVEVGEDTPLVTYLDLTNNYVRKISAMRSLVNLEVLLLSDNYISSIDPNTLKNLTKLRFLDLSFNLLSRISTDIFPKSLTKLDLYACQVKVLNYGEMYFPSLEVLNVEQNELKSIDASALNQAMPKLKLIRIADNRFEEDDFRQALQLFLQHNVSVRDDADEAACGFNEQLIAGVCFSEDRQEDRGGLQDVGLSLLLILVVVALVAILRWTIKAMSSK